MKTKKLTGLVFLSALLSVSASSCQSTKMEEKFEWSGTLSAPHEYPAEVYTGNLKSDDYTQHFKNWGIINSGWGEANGTVVAGPAKKALPDSLSLTWLSFVENKFYTGKFALPKDRMQKLFKEGYVNDLGKQKTFTEIVVGLAPEGTVSVWVMAAGKEVEVSQFKAHTTTIDPETIANDDKYMFKADYVKGVLANTKVIAPEVREKIGKDGYPSPANYEQVYTKKYNWKPQFELPEGGTMKNFGYTTYNGEMDKLFGESLAKNEPKERAIPKRAYFYWFNAAKEQHGVKVEAFDDKEIIDAFAAVGSGEIQIVFKVSADNSVTLKLKSDAKEIEIKKAVVKVF